MKKHKKTVKFESLLAKIKIHKNCRSDTPKIFFPSQKMYEKSFFNKKTDF